MIPKYSSQAIVGNKLYGLLCCPQNLRPIK